MTCKLILRTIYNNEETINNIEIKSDSNLYF